MAPTCPFCHGTVAPDARRCPHCGRSLIGADLTGSEATSDSTSHGATANSSGPWWRRLLVSILADARAWCHGREWWLRAPLVLYMAWIALRLTGDRAYHSLFGGINLGIHEAGHLLFAFGPRPLMVAGGTLLQLAAPLITIGLFARQRDHIGIAFAGTWLATNLAHVAVYMADARALALNLVTVGGGGPAMPKEEFHDWSYMLGGLGLRAYDTVLAGGVTVLAWLIAWASVAYGVWLLWTMARSNRRPLT